MPWFEMIQEIYYNAKADGRKEKDTIEKIIEHGKKRGKDIWKRKRS